MEKIYSAKTVDEAIEMGLNELNKKKEEVEITVIEEKCGLIKKSATVSIKFDEKLTAEDFLKEILKKMGVEASVEKSEDNEQLTLNIVCENSSDVIGYRGDTLNALQTLISSFVNAEKGKYKRVLLDAENYREKRIETLANLANKLADKAVKYSRRFALEPMSAYERRIIHSALTDRTDVTTESEGEEPFRHIVVIPKEEKSFSKRDGGGRNGGKRENKQSGFSSTSAPRKAMSGFGTYLGNSKND